MKSDKERNVQACLSEIGVEINKKKQQFIELYHSKKIEIKVSYHNN